ncbi:short-chain dehydrogenase/reductase-like protein [Ascodesmis nigricans]|uniref:Short-chain dehydrogenase/reductase-like protein n=1 Tax=Ascodesmis nigricans TaxID=341454 RepID=A0A4S2N5Q3_9PEZI|nr:short-chain dehydrogenase/reductase-like protein [Ascodesmis nigricans]
MPFNLVCPASRGLSLALARTLLQRSPHPLIATARTNPDEVKGRILSGLNIPDDQVTVLQVDVTEEDTLSSAVQSIKQTHPNDHLNILISSAGVLHPERSPKDITKSDVLHTLSTNLLGPMLVMKHFSPFLPSKKTALDKPAVWVNISARVGSIEDNRLGGWYSYRATKAGVNQLTKTLNIHLKATAGGNAFAVAMHPGTVKTDLSREFWGNVEKEKLFEPEYAAERLVGVVERLGDGDGGGFFDWKGERIPW